jgi:hypothetical protein
MPNWIPFLLLTVASLLLLGYTYYQKKTPLVFFFWLSFSGLAYFFEFIIFILLDSYHYSPNILGNHYNDNVLGSISSQALAVPIAVTFAAVLNLRKRWIFLFVGLFLLIEKCFLHLEVYEHHWWRTYYTCFFLLIAFFLGKMWYRKLSNRKTTKLYWLSLFFALVTVVTTTAWILSSLLHIVEIQPNLFQNNDRDLVVGSVLYFSFVSLLYSFVIYYHNRNILYYIGTVTFLLLIEIFMIAEGLLYVYGVWLLPVFHCTMLSAGSYIFRKQFPQYALEKNKKNRGRHSF